jgi:hypothetical protein
MATGEFSLSPRAAADQGVVVRAVTVIMGAVVGLTFLFGFGNVLNLALRLGVPVWVAPLVAPAVDLSILGLLLGTRHLALRGASVDQLRPARRLLIFASMVTLALNVADPIVAGEYGKAAFDAVGPLLLIGWAEVGPGLLQAINAASSRATGIDALGACAQQTLASPKPADRDRDEPDQQKVGEVVRARRSDRKASPRRSPQVLLEQARQEDATHRALHQKPISAHTLRARLGIGTAASRRLVKIVRSEVQSQFASHLSNDGTTAMAMTVDTDATQAA